MKKTKKEIVETFNFLLELYDDTEAGREECIGATADKLEIPFSRVDKAVNT